MREHTSQILVVDDDLSMRNLLHEWICSFGYGCYVAESGAAAKTRLATQRFDLVLTDLNMPGADGIEVLQHVLVTHPETAVIVISGVRSTDTAVMAMRLGAYDYIQKPTTATELLERIHRALVRRNLLRVQRNHRQNLEQQIREKTRQIRKQADEIDALYLAEREKSKQLEIALRNIQQTYSEAQEALLVTLGFRDTETKGHCRRVMGYSCLISQAMGMPQEELTHLKRGSLLHDIGKIGIPDRVLYKRGALNNEEWELMRKHPLMGHQMMAEIHFLTPASPIVLYHHERYDGGGYPYGLAGDEIPLAARIFAITDALDAITTKRPYREARSLKAAREKIARCAGSQFDPAIVEIFLNIPDVQLSEIQQMSASTPQTPNQSAEKLVYEGI